MNKNTPARRLAAALALACTACLTSCGSFYFGQVEVPGTNQRLIVGSDDWPFRKVWVEENGVVQKVRVVRNR